jgi:uncharacterized repeat protein (TIGR03803 family)
MARKRLLIAVTFAALILLPNTWARSGKEYKFRGMPDAELPGGLVADGVGNFYGTSQGGRNSCSGINPPTCGAVFEVSRDQSGHWSENVIYSFAGGSDGIDPEGELIFDAVGNLYGTTTRGGNPGDGTVFRLSPNQNGTWTKAVLYNFQGGADGGAPLSGVILDSAGSLYGTTTSSGVCNPYCGGTVFKLTPGQGGSWSKNTLFTFPGGVNGTVSPSALVLDATGNLYGSTSRGGAAGWGTVFQLAPNQDGTWTETDIYSFTDGLDGGYPSGAVTFDNAGNLYGEASVGGSFACPISGCGVIFKLSPELGNWTFTVAHTFNGLNGSKGQQPGGGLVFDDAGNMYGTTRGTVCGSFCGTIFKLSPNTGGGFTFSMIGAFNNIDGAFPAAGVIVDSAGNLYGTAQVGGNLNCNAPFGCGVVFTLTP